MELLTLAIDLAPPGRDPSFLSLSTPQRSFKHYKLLQQSHPKGDKESQITASKAAESFKQDTPPMLPSAI